MRRRLASRAAVRRLGVALGAALISISAVGAPVAAVTDLLGAEIFAKAGSDSCELVPDLSAVCETADDSDFGGLTVEATARVEGTLEFAGPGDLVFITTVGSARGTAKSDGDDSDGLEAETSFSVTFEAVTPTVMLISGSLGVVTNGAPACSQIQMGGIQVFRAIGSTCAEDVGTPVNVLDEEILLNAGQSYSLSVRANGGALAPEGTNSANSRGSFDLDIELVGCDNVFTAGNDEVEGTPADEVLCGGTGEDIIFGGGGNDRILGGADADSLHGDDGDDRIEGGPGDDEFLNGNAGNDFIDGGPGDDGDFEFNGGPGRDVLIGGDGHDSIQGGSGNDRLIGGAHIDWLEGDDGDDVLFGDAGRDGLLGGAGEDHADGGADDDALLGGASADSLVGGPGHDGISGGGGGDILLGDGGDDVLSGDGGADHHNGGAGRDRMLGGDQPDTFAAKDGKRDVVKGGAGRDEARVDRIDLLSSIEDTRR